MKSKSGVTSWQDVGHKPLPTFSGDKRVDVVIVGGGMAGVFSAYLLAQAGKKVALLEKEKLGSGYTLCTTAFLTQSIDTDTADLMRLFERDMAKKVLQSHQHAIDLIDNIVRKEGIDCEFMRCSNFIYANSEKDLKPLAEEAQALTELDVKIRLSEKGSDLGIPNKGYIEVCDQAKFHPMKFLFGLADAVVNMGGEIYEKSEAEKLETIEGGRQKVHTKTGTIEADYAIVTTYKPFNNPLSLYFKKGSYLSYVLELELKNQKLKEGTYEDMENPYHYFRVDGNRVIIGGEDHRKEIKMSETKNFNALVDYADSIFKDYEITKKWDGIILEPVDGLPTIGQINDDHVLYALGFSGNGMTYSAISAMIFRDIITGSDNSLIPVYHPRRHMGVKKLATKARDYAEEMAHGALKNAIKQRKKPKF